MTIEGLIIGFVMMILLTLVLGNMLTVGVESNTHKVIEAKGGLFDSIID